MRRLLLAVVVGALALLASAAPAQAHAELIGTSPGKGKTVSAPPKIVVLQFSERVLKLGLRVQVTGPAGRSEDGDPQLAGAAVVQSLKRGLPAGDYRVDWRVTSDDGHPISGTFRFEASGPGAGASATSGPSASQSATPSAGVSPSASAGPAPSAEPTVVPPVEPVSSGGSPTLAWTIVGIVIVVAGLIAALVALRRPRRSGSPASSGPGSPPPNPRSGADPPAPPSD